MEAVRLCAVLQANAAEVQERSESRPLLPAWVVTMAAVVVCGPAMAEQLPAVTVAALKPVLAALEPPAPAQEQSG